MSLMKRHPNFKDVSGKRFGKLIAVSVAGKLGATYLWNCICDCGGSTVLRVSYLISGHTRSCGCLAPEVNRDRMSTHRMSKTRMYGIWSGIHYRCTASKTKQFKNYGGRGIKVCERWNSFDNFYMDMGDPPPGFTIERKDNDGDYEPGNCRWATRLEQGRNKTINRFVTINGVSKCLSEWASILGVKAGTFQARLERGWTPEEAANHVLDPRGGQNRKKAA